MKTHRITSILAALAMAITFNTALAKKKCDNQDIIDLGAGASGKAKLCMNDKGMKAKFKVDHLMEGDAYTVWWVYFDDPSLCTHGPAPGTCGEGDLAPSEAGGGTPLGVFGRFGSTVGTHNGKAHISDSWGGMLPSIGAEIWILMLSHGPANYWDGRHLARQLLTPEDPLAGMPHLGNDVDGPGFIPVALTVHIVD
jgi:hypothetical protein